MVNVKTGIRAGDNVNFDVNLRNSLDVNFNLKRLNIGLETRGPNVVDYYNRQQGPILLPTN